MNKTSYYTTWAGIYILCAGFSFIPEPTGFLKFLMIFLSLLFFVPPACLLHLAGKEKDRFSLKVIRNLSLMSLILTVAVLIVSVLSFLAPEWVGNFLHILLILTSVPMVCGQYWVVSLFFWACLLLVSLKALKK